MKKHWYKRTCIVLAALLLLFILPISAMAEKGMDGKTVSAAALVKASASNISRKAATPSNAERDTELIDGELENDLNTEANGDVDLKREDVDTNLTGDLESEKNEEASGSKTTVLSETTIVSTAVQVSEKPLEEQLAGTWAADEITVYRFRDDNTGALLLPEHTYGFEYAIEDDELVLRFEDSKIGKMVFLFTLEEDTLILERLEGGFGEVELVKRKK